jgi:general bacterial porin, GBP family
MQKKIIALAVAGLVSGAAFAQSNVVIYGVADAGYVYGSDSYVDGTKSTSKMASGGQSGSRLGFKGEEALGNGLTATFKYEQAINLDTGGETVNNGGRWATVGLSGKSWGSFEMGRRDTFIDQVYGGTDVQDRVTVGQMSPVMRDTGRISNFFAWTSPSWSGLTVKAGVSTNPWADEVEPNDAGSGTTNVRYYTAAAEYANGGLKVGLAYERNKGQSNGGDSFDAGSEWVLGGKYKFGMVTLGAQYGQISNSEDITNPLLGDADIEKRKQWTVGAMFDITAKDRFAVNYARGKNEFFDSRSDEKQRMWGVSYFHDLSKRTNIYAGYGNLNQSSDNTKKYGIDGTYQKAIQVGLRHRF